jgi:energy-coupling factor transporter ATP-binding protein EcfA2
VNELHHFVRVDFHRFKAFKQFTLYLKHFNILVGPNNSGKSTILAAFRVLAAALRKARARKPEIVPTPQGKDLGYQIDLSGVSVAEENIFFNYDDSAPASVRFKLSNKNELVLYFPELGSCFLSTDGEGPTPRTPTTFRKHFNCPIGFVPILGPVDHNELLYQEEAARLALFNYTAARNFRNIWHHYPERFDDFKRILIQTWPGMDIERPKVDYTHEKPRLHMFCPEERIPREICWAGFGFQVWCQMLTHLVQSSDKALFLIDEPDIYLHADLQRQLLSLLRNLGPDILVATHSTEIITEAEPDDIVVVSKKKKHARRIKQPSELVEVFSVLGSNLNPILTQLAKSRRAVFVEGKDFQIVSKFARKLNCPRVGNRSEFAVIPLEGFNPERARNLIKGIETTLGGKIAAAIVLDRDYRSQEECEAIRKLCEEFCDLVHIHGSKEIENFLLVPESIDRAASRRTVDRAKRGGRKVEYVSCAQTVLQDFAEEKRTYVMSQCVAHRRSFQGRVAPAMDEATVTELALAEFDSRWNDDDRRLATLPGKAAFSRLNEHLQQEFGITVTPTGIIDAMKADEVPAELKRLIGDLDAFARLSPGSTKDQQ